MNIEHYEQKIIVWDKYPDSIKPTIYLLGGFGELGELIEKLLDHLDNYKKIQNRQIRFALEMGDIYWYMIRLANSLGFTYSEIKKMSIEEPIKVNDIHKNLLRLVVEIGKLTNQFKKVFRDHQSIMPKGQIEYGERIARIFVYLEEIVNETGFTVDEVLEMNYEKLDSRYKRHKIGGSGDER